MADFGAFFRAEDGSLLTTSDTPCYEFFGDVGPSTRTWNVNEYYVTSGAIPLVFVNCGVGGMAGVLAIEGAPGWWRVTVLCNVSCSISVFTPIAGQTSSGHGIAAYDSGGRLVFDSARKMLNARAVSEIKSGQSFQSPAGVNMVAYVSGPVRPTSSVSYSWELLETYMYPESIYSCSYGYEYLCRPQTSYRCNFVYVCTPSYQCSFDPITGGSSCGFADSCSYQNVCDWVTENVCGMEFVQKCGWTFATIYSFIYGNIKTTNWSIDRGTARLSPDGTVTFGWLLHKSGFYRQIVEYRTDGHTQVLSGGLPLGYIPPYATISSRENYDGELSKTNTFPYADGLANDISLTCITAVRSDYD